MYSLPAVERKLSPYFYYFTLDGNVFHVYLGSKWNQVSCFPYLSSPSCNQQNKTIQNTSHRTLLKRKICDKSAMAITNLQPLRGYCLQIVFSRLYSFVCFKKNMVKIYLSFDKLFDNQNGMDTLLVQVLSKLSKYHIRHKSNKKCVVTILGTNPTKMEWIQF